jgi:hypothetical protein
VPHQRPRARWIESAAVLGAWLALAGLASARASLSFDGVLGQPFLSVLVAVLALWIAPGFALWRSLIGGPWRHGPAWSFGLGLSWTLVAAAAGMIAGASLERLLGALVVLNGLLAAAFIAWRMRPPRGAIPAGETDGPPPTPWVIAAVAAVMARLLDLATRRLHRLTHGSDEWVLMGAVRAFLERPTVADAIDFDVCDLAIALVARLSGVEVFDVYRLHLPPLLVLAGALAFLVLAEAVLRDRGLAWIALAVQGLLALSEMYPRGEGLGMAMLVRQVEDKFVALLVVLPLAQAAFLWAVRGGGRTPLALLAFLGLAATLLQPAAVPWLALTCGVTYVAALATGQVARSRRLLIALSAMTVAGLALAWALRALRPSPYFALYDPTWPFNATLRELSVRQLWILSLEKGWYMAHPWLLNHPLTIAALAGSLLLLPRFRRSLQAQWLLLATWVPVLLTFNPLTAVALGWLVTPWRLYRLLWVMPVALVMAWLLGTALGGLEARVVRRWPSGQRRRLAAGPLALAALAVVAALLAPRMGESARALRARNRVLVKPGEKEFLHDLSTLMRERRGGLVLAPEGLSVRLPAWTSRLQPLCGISAIRAQASDLLRACAAFQEGPEVGAAGLALLRGFGVSYVITEEASPVEAVLRARPHAFRPLLRAGELALYEWRPERWTEAPR